MVRLWVHYKHGNGNLYTFLDTASALDFARYKATRRSTSRMVMRPENEPDRVIWDYAWSPVSQAVGLRLPT